jgi:hypothetical protein
MKTFTFFAGLILLTLCFGPKASAQIQPDNFGWQCGPGKTTNCPINTTNAPDCVLESWPSGMPNLLRLHDSGTEWSEIEQMKNTYTWCDLNAYLDAIAAHLPRTVIEVFTAVPCWDTKVTTCGIGDYPHGTNYLPDDLTSTGSPAFNAFVTQFVQHCSTNMNCVGPCPQGQTCNSTNLIKYFDLWNEWDLNEHWMQGAPPNGCGTTASECGLELYYMVAPAVPIIKQYIPNPWY